MVFKYSLLPSWKTLSTFRPQVEQVSQYVQRFRSLDSFLARESSITLGLAALIASNKKKKKKHPKKDIKVSVCNQTRKIQYFLESNLFILECYVKCVCIQDRYTTNTLCSNEDHWHLSCVSVAGQAQEVIVDCLKADLILQAKDENHCIHPGSKLRTRQRPSTVCVMRHPLKVFTLSAQN